MKLIITSIFILLSLNIHALNGDDYIGLTPEKLISNIGAPAQVLAQRGDVKVEDDVVFFYDNRTYFYFNQSRLWQVRFDNKYNGEILDIKIGSTREEIIEKLGEPIKEDSLSIIFKRPDKGYPVFLRIFLNQNKAEDIYFYRGDY